MAPDEGTASGDVAERYQLQVVMLQETWQQCHQLQVVMLQRWLLPMKLLHLETWQQRHQL
jgi:hypothetical protein